MHVCSLTLARSASLAFAIGMSTSVFGFGGNNGTVCPTPVGPDVIVGDITTLTANYAAQQLDGVWYDAFSLGTSSCNVGNQNVVWQAFPSNLHPAIAQSIYKYKNGRLEQIGMSWLKHGFTALTLNICGCGCSGQGGSVLGVGCSDPYTASRNGSQGGLGPRWQVNANTGFFPTNGPANPPWSGSTARRLRVKSSDLEVSGPGVSFWVECQYVTQDDATAGNQNNNASHRQANLTGGPNEFSISLTGSTQRMLPAISVWKKLDPAVVQSNIEIPNEGLIILSSRATSLGDGQWHYEYAIQNVNSDYSVQAFSVPVPQGAVLSNIGFHDVDYHSWDGQGSMNDSTKKNFDGSDWPAAEGSSSITWATDLFENNNNANAIRWGTMYNFRFDSDLPPQNGEGTITTYKTVTTQNGAAVVPGLDCNSNDVADSVDISNGTSLDANTNGIPDECEKPTGCKGDANGDNTVDTDDLLMVINGWGAAGAGDVNGSGITDTDDLIMVINAWGACQ